MTSVAQLQAELTNAQNALKAGTINQTQYNEFYRTQTVLIAQAKATEGSAVSPLPYDPTTGGARTGVTPGIGTSTGGQSTGNYVKVPGGGYTLDYWQGERDNLSYQLQHGQISREEYDQRYDEYTGYMEQLGYSAPASNPLAEALDQQKNFDQALKDNVITPEEHATATGKQGEIIKDMAGDMYKPPTNYKYNPPIIPGAPSSSGTAFKPPEFTDEYVAKNSPDLFVGPMQNPQVGPVNLLPQTLLPVERIKILSDAPPNTDYLNAEAMIWLEQAKADRMLKQGTISAEQYADITNYLTNTSKYNKDLYNAWVLDNYFAGKHAEMVKNWTDTAIVGAAVIAAPFTGGGSLAASAGLFGTSFAIGAGVSNIFNYLEHGELLSLRDTVVAGAGSALFANVGGHVIRAGFSTVAAFGAAQQSKMLWDIGMLGLGRTASTVSSGFIASAEWAGISGSIAGGLLRASTWGSLAGGVGYVASGGNMQKTGFSVLTAFGGSLAFEGALGLYGRYVANRGGGGGAGSGAGGRGGSGEGEWLLPDSAGGKGQTGGDVVLSSSSRLAIYNSGANLFSRSPIIPSVVGGASLAPVAGGRTNLPSPPGNNVGGPGTLAELIPAPPASNLVTDLPAPPGNNAGGPGTLAELLPEAPKDLISSGPKDTIPAPEPSNPITELPLPPTDTGKLDILPLPPKDIFTPTPPKRGEYIEFKPDTSKDGGSVTQTHPNLNQLTPKINFDANYQTKNLYPESYNMKRYNAKINPPKEEVKLWDPEDAIIKRKKNINTKIDATLTEMNAVDAVGDKIASVLAEASGKETPLIKQPKVKPQGPARDRPILFGSETMVKTTTRTVNVEPAISTDVPALTGEALNIYLRGQASRVESVHSRSALLTALRASDTSGSTRTDVLNSIRGSLNNYKPNTKNRTANTISTVSTTGTISTAATPSATNIANTLIPGTTTRTNQRTPTRPAANPILNTPQANQETPTFESTLLTEPNIYTPINTPTLTPDTSQTTSYSNAIDVGSSTTNAQSRLPFPVPWLPGIPGGSSQKPFNFRSGHVTKKTHAIPLPKDLLNQFGGKTKRVSLFGSLTSKQTKPVTRKRNSSSKKSGRQKSKRSKR